MASVWAIVLAAGRGERFGGRKQAALLGGVPLVHRAVTTAAACVDEVVVVLPADTHWDGPPVTDWVVGGHTRADSVRAGLAAVPAAADTVVIAMAAHPLASQELFRSVISAVADGAAAAVPCVASADVTKHVRDGRILGTLLPREQYLLAQTPQAFRAEVLRHVHADHPQPVEDSVLVEELGELVVSVPGEVTNIHVAIPEDLAAAECIWQMISGPPRRPEASTLGPCR